MPRGVAVLYRLDQLWWRSAAQPHGGSRGGSMWYMLESIYRIPFEDQILEICSAQLCLHNPSLIVEAKASLCKAN